MKRIKVVWLYLVFVLAVLSCATGKNILDDAESLVIVPKVFDMNDAQTLFGYYSMSYCNKGADDILGYVKFIKMQKYAIIKDLPDGEYYLKDIYFNYTKGSTKRVEKSSFHVPFMVKKHTISFPALQFITRTEKKLMRYDLEVATGDPQLEIIKTLEQDEKFYNKWEIGSLGSFKNKDGSEVELLYKDGKLKSKVKVVVTGKASFMPETKTIINN